MSESLTNKTVKGVFWSAADTFLGNGVTFFIGIVLARLLSPDEYGLIGLVLIFTVVLASVVDAGFTQALVRKKDTTDDDCNTMFITNMVSSLLMFALLFVCAPFIAAFFSRPELTSIARVNAKGQGAEFAYIPHVYVSPMFRHKRIFSNMLEIVVRHIKDKGFHEIRLEVDKQNKLAQQSYQRNGFDIMLSQNSNLPSFYMSKIV